MSVTDWAIIFTIIIGLFCVFILFLDRFLNSRGTTLKFTGLSTKRILFYVAMTLALVVPIPLLLILLYVTNNICYTGLGLGIFVLAILVTVTVAEFRGAGQHREDAVATNKVLKMIDAASLGLQKVEYFRFRGIQPDLPTPLYSFMGRYKGHLTYIAFNWQSEYLALRVPDGLKIEMNHMAKFKTRVAVPTPFPADEGEEGSNEKNIEKMQGFLKFLYDKKILPRIGELGVVERLYVDDLSVGIRVVKMEKGKALGMLLDVLAEACEFVESQCEPLTINDVTRKNKFELNEDDPDLVSGLVRFDDTRIVKMCVDETKVKELESRDYSEIISLTLGCTDEEGVWINSLDIIFKDRKYFKIDVLDPVSRMGVRALIFDKLGLLKKKEGLDAEGKKE